MYLLKVTSPEGSDFIAAGKTKKEAMTELINSYKAFYHMTLEDLAYEHGYTDFETYFNDYLGIEILRLNPGETYICGYGKYYKNGINIKG